MKDGLPYDPMEILGLVDVGMRILKEKTMRVDRVLKNRPKRLRTDQNRES